MKQKPKVKKLSHEDFSKHAPMPDVIHLISERLAERLNEGKKRGEVISHNLEYGLGAENVLRSLIREVLPLKYGIGKGKVVNHEGKTSRHLDIIIYDGLNCPTLFVDEHQNLILPIESVYAVIEVKTQTTSSVLKEAFENLASVAGISEGLDCSTNELLEYCPPRLSIFSFNDERKLETIRDNFIQLSESFPRKYSFSRYSKKSPGHKECNQDFYLVESILVLGKGEVYHMLNGRLAIGRWGSNSFGMFITSLLSELSQVKLLEYRPTNYLNWISSGAREIYEKEQ